MSGPSRVAIVRCRSYRNGEVEDAVAEGFRLLGPLASFLEGKRRVLLKPNLLHGDDPGRGSTTHPALLRALALSCVRLGLEVSYGDSPAFHNPKTAVIRSGFAEVALETGIRLADFETGEERSFPDGLQNRVFFVARGVIEADAVVNLPKLKTHGLTGMTGAVKNMFGVIPGLRKAGFHARLSDSRSFSKMIVDLSRFITPAISVMDAVYGMEGNGPRNGQLVHTGLLLISSDPVALDATAGRIIGLNPEEVYFLHYAESIGFGNIAENNIEILGVPLHLARGKPYALHPPETRSFSTSPWQRQIKRFLIPRPVITSTLCTRCGQCVRICPVEPKALAAGKGKDPPVFDYQTCIRCYCCQETCPEGAIAINVPFWGRLFHGRKGRF